MEGCKSIAAGVNAMDLRTGINMAVDAVVSDLKSKAVMISTPEEITQVTSWRNNLGNVFIMSVALSFQGCNALLPSGVICKTLRLALSRAV